MITKKRLNILEVNECLLVFEVGKDQTQVRICTGREEELEVSTTELACFLEETLLDLKKALSDHS